MQYEDEGATNQSMLSSKAALVSHLFAMLDPHGDPANALSTKAAETYPCHPQWIIVTP